METLSSWTIMVAATNMISSKAAYMEVHPFCIIPSKPPLWLFYVVRLIHNLIESDNAELSVDRQYKTLLSNEVTECKALIPIIGPGM